MSKFNVTKKSDPMYDQLAADLAVISASTNFDYNGVVTNYNELGVEDIMDFAFPKARTISLVNQLTKRGLKKDVDYTLVVTEVGGEDATETTPAKPGVEMAFLTRVSQTKGQTVKSMRGRRGPLSDEEKAAKAAARASNKATKPTAPAAPKAAAKPAGKPAKPAAKGKGK